MEFICDANHDLTYIDADRMEVKDGMLYVYKLGRLVYLADVSIILMAKLTEPGAKHE